MRKLLFTTCLMSVFFCASAQDYKSFRVGLGFGYAVPGGEGAKGGVIVYLEPAYRLNDAFLIGLRLEAAAMARTLVVNSGNTSLVQESEVKANASYTINGQYYFTTGGFRAFAGLGLGLYALASQSLTGSTVSTTASTNEFGFYPRIGFDAGHFTLQMEYNFLPTKTAVLEIDVGNTPTLATAESKNSYLGLKAGFFIGGGKKQ